MELRALPLGSSGGHLCYSQAARGSQETARGLWVPRQGWEPLPPPAFGDAHPAVLTQAEARRESTVMTAHPGATRLPQPAPGSGRLTGKELPRLVGVSEVHGPLQHPEVRPRGVSELDEHVGHVENLQVVWVLTPEGPPTLPLRGSLLPSGHLWVCLRGPQEAPAAKNAGRGTVPGSWTRLLSPALPGRPPASSQVAFPGWGGTTYLPTARLCGHLPLGLSSRGGGGDEPPGDAPCTQAFRGALGDFGWPLCQEGSS